MQSAQLTSIAARKAALFEKIGASASGSPATTKDSSAVNPVYLAAPSFTQPDWVRLVAERRDRKDTCLSVATTSTAYSGAQLTPAKLTPMPTGSTVVSATADLGLGHPSQNGQGPLATDFTSLRRSSAGSKVKMAVLALNAMEKVRQAEGGPTWRVGAAPSPVDRDSRPGTSMRSWSRLSGATAAFGEPDVLKSSDPEISSRDRPFDFEDKLLDEEKNLEDGELIIRGGDDEINLSTPVHAAPYPDVLPDTTLASNLATYSLESIKDVEDEADDMDDEAPVGALDETFDTHPPDMVSPRTGLAYVMLPPWARSRPDDCEPKLIKPSQCRFSRKESGVASKDVSEVPNSEGPRYAHGLESIAVASSPTQLDLNEVPSPSAQHAPLTPDLLQEVHSEPDDRNGIPEASPPTSPCASPTPPPRAQLSRSTNTPIILRGEGKRLPLHPKRHSTILSGTRPSTTNHIRSMSISNSPTPSLSRVRRASAMTPAPIRPQYTGMQPTKFWQAPERFRRPSSVLSVSMPQWETPVETKAHNKIPLRKVQTPGSAMKAMRFSGAF
ncbi:hypothetical protein FS837_005651 [Tulasnella sp. UAMH 9824]|nr:hypothetical protein FS837_005651 [Tulasnella sp. UAMH 9824]